MSAREPPPAQASLAFAAWVERARAADILATANALGARLKRAGAAENVGPCPLCGGTDRFAVNSKQRVFVCRGSGAGGDVIALAMHVKACEFIPACETILGEPPPGRDSRPPDPEIERERRDERRDREITRHVEETEEIAASIKAATDLFESGEPIRNTWADDYLERRGIVFRDDEAINLRFVRALPYWGFADPAAEEVVELGAFPCMLAAIRDLHGNIQGVHRTYLDDRTPSKLIPPGDRLRNKAKKVYRRAGGGIIWLGPISPIVAIGEGIETAFSFHKLALGPEDAAVASAVSLGNLAGSALDSKRHPRIAGRTIPSGEPDPSKPGIVLPDAVREVVLLGDGDSDPIETRARLLIAARRFKAQGRTVSIAMAPAGSDFNNLLLSQVVP